MAEEHSDRPQLRRSRDRSREEDTFSVASYRTIPDVGADRRLWQRLIGAVSAMTASGAGAEEAYRSALEQLREYGGEAVDVIAATYEQLEENAYQEQWALVQLLTDLALPETTRFFGHLVQTPVPEERSRDTVHGVSTVTEEVVLRTTAIEGLSRRIRDGDREAVDALLPALEHEYVAMRRAAWHGLVDGGDEDGIARGRDILSSRGDDWIIEIRRTPVVEIDQPRPEPGEARPTAEPPNPFDEARPHGA
ncbi:hypothetical protein ACFPER_09570 [Agromyces aurantiacus]|uniref:DUF222 domain-containing protein n=1 Tax=Agromyces aurantiacus TaxID=165814 RepID=A0ABV9R6Z9_9MICO|nr:hypothetical protein [Agromyces aurantiacus]MBM7503722.1 hypothetical protein [Agromyces aurantiacus]